MAMLCYVLAALCLVYCVGVVATKAAGTKFYLIWLAGTALFGLFGFFVQKGLWMRLPIGLRAGIGVLAGVGITCLCALLVLIGSTFSAKGEQQLSYLIVLGAQMKPNGPSVVLEKRLRRAYTYLTENPETLCVLSGGQGSNEPVSEAQGMYEDLVKKGIRFSLEQDGFEVACAYDGEEALQMAKETEYDMVLLDVMLPKLNGFEVCQAIREFSEMPIIMLTAKGDDMDKILGLEYGADDYITKPFNILEVKARIKAILRRNSKKSRQEPQQTKKVIEAGDLTLDSDSRRVFIASREINLTAKEFDLLELLVCNPGKVYSREELLRFVWGNRAAAGGDVRTVDVHVRRLREKIEPSPSDPKYVHTKWGVGYYFRIR